MRVLLFTQQYSETNGSAVIKGLIIEQLYLQPVNVLHIKQPE